MDAREMQTEFVRRLELMNPVFSLNEKPTSEVIFSFLNAYAQRLARISYIGDDLLPAGSRAHKRNEDILGGYLTRTLLTIQPKDTNNYDKVTDRATLPNDYFMYVRSNSVLSKTYKDETEITNPVNYVSVANLSIKHDAVPAIISNPYNNIIMRNPYIIIDGGEITNNNNYLNIIHDQFTIVKNIDLVYYRKPREFNVINVDNVNIFSSTDFPESCHMEIVEGALEMYLTEARFRLTPRSEE